MFHLSHNEAFCREKGEEKKIPARAAFSRRFAILQWKKPIFPVTRENEKEKKRKKEGKKKMLHTNVTFPETGVPRYKTRERERKHIPIGSDILTNAHS